MLEEYDTNYDCADATFTYTALLSNGSALPSFIQPSWKTTKNNVKGNWFTI
jgi:hypothetical protein